MTKQELETLFNSCASTFESDQIGEFQYFMHIYIKMFKKYPNVITLDTDGYYLNPQADDFDNFDDDDENDEYIEESNDTPKIYTFGDIFVQKTMLKMYEHFKDVAYTIRKEEYPIIIADELFIFWSSYTHMIYVMQQSDVLSDELKALVVDDSNVNEDESRFFSYVTTTSQGFNSTALKIKKTDIDLAANYNDDLPDKEIKDFLKSKQSGLLLLHGEPGSGKTTYIRHLITTLRGRHFIVLDSSVFAYITDSSFINFLLDNKNSVIILEDCESMLADRAAGNNQLATLLNLSDGIIGDSFNFKFICTFNANISKLDKAILRKGRMRLKYEFKALTPEKTKALGQKLGYDIPDGKALTLGDIFNYNIDNGNKNIEKKIGFSN